MSRKTIEVERLSAWGVAVLLVQLALLNPRIAEIGWPHMLVGAVSLGVGIGAAYLLLTTPRNHLDWAVVVWVPYLLAAGAWACLANGTFQDASRAIVPFLYLAPLYVVVSRLDSAGRKRILQLLLLICAAAALVGLGTLMADGLGGRMTASFGLIRIPVLMIGISLSVLCLPPGKIRIGLVLLFVVDLFLTRSRGQIVAGGLLVLSLLLWTPGRTTSRLPVAYRLSLAAAWAALLIVVIIGPEWIRLRPVRATELTNAHRLEELGVAWSHFLDDPIFGAGLGASFEVHGLNPPGQENQRYLHSLVFYWLATGGIVGLLVYLTPFVAIFRSAGWRCVRPPPYYLALAIIGILLYSLVTATFKTIHTNAFLGVLLGAFVAELGSETRNDAGAHEI